MDEKTPKEESPKEEVQKEVRPLSHLTIRLVAAIEKKETEELGRKISVNPVVARVATWYEKIRNAMEYREEEVILRATIERILRRRILLGGTAKTIAEPLLRELVWARYLPDASVSEAIIPKIERSIDVFMGLRQNVVKRHGLSEHIMNEWMYELLSSDLEEIIQPNIPEETVANFMYQVLESRIRIVDDSEETKNVQVYIAVRRAFARDDLPFLRYHLFRQIFGRLTEENLDRVSEEFPKGYEEIVSQLKYKKKDTIYSYVKRRTAAFLILEEVLVANKDNAKALVENPQALEQAITEECEKRYASIGKKVKTAIIRSVVFILLTKLAFAVLVEGTYERFAYGKILWGTIVLNTGIPPLLMLVVGFFLRPPGERNTKRIFAYIKSLLYDEKPTFGNDLVISYKDRDQGFLGTLFSTLWFLAFILSFGLIIYILSLLNFSYISMFVFLFFLTIVSFLAYRISQTAHLYRLGDEQGLLTPIIDFLFLPIIRVGRHLTEGISQINFIIFLFDFIIETPFKVLFAFFEQLFYFLHAKRDELG